MAGNGSKHGDSITEQSKEKYAALHDKLDDRIARAEIRQELNSADFQEDSALIQREVDRRLAEQKTSSEPPKSGIVGQGVRGFQKLTTGWPWQARLILLLALILALATRPDMAKIGQWLAGLW